MRLRLACYVIVLSLTPALATDYDERRAAAVKTCEAIDPAASQSGLYMNPDGYRSYYVRSQCFQQAAVQFRDDRLCALVKRRWSLMSSSWGYSAAQCRSLVADGLAMDRRALEDLKRQYGKGAVTLRDFRVEPNGNGRDFDFLPSFAGGPGAGYTLTFDIVPPDSSHPPILLHSSGYFIDGQSNLRVYVTGEDIRRRFPGFDQTRHYTVRATLILSMPTGTGDARMRDAFIEGVFPSRERSQSITREIEFRASPPPRRLRLP